VGQFLGRVRRGLHVAVLCLASAAAGAGSLGDARAPSAAERSSADTDIFYHVFVRSFRDANHDGIGDLDGLRAGLDYLQQLGITALLLTPAQLRAAHRHIAYWPDIVAPIASATDQLQTLTATYQPDELIWMDIEVDTHRRLDAMERLARVIGR